MLKRKLHQNFLVLGLKLLGGILTERKGRLLCETGNKSRSSCSQATCDMTEPSPPSAVSSPTSVSPASNLVRFFLTLEPFHTWSPFTETIFFFFWVSLSYRVQTVFKKDLQEGKIMLSDFFSIYSY